jgi:hypothetical protein
VVVWRIRTPTDLRDAFAHSARAHFIAIADDIEPDVRRAWDEIFEDFTLIEPTVDPPGLVSSYLDSVAEPIARLRELGVQLVAVKGSGTVSGPNGPIPWTRTDLVIAPDPCWFRNADAANGAVHMLGVHCLEGHQVFMQTGVPVRVWLSRDQIEEAFERNTPWCTTCGMADVETH